MCEQPGPEVQLHRSPCSSAHTNKFVNGKISYGSQIYCWPAKTINASNILRTFVVLWPITTKFRTCGQAKKRKTSNICCFRISFPAPDWLFPCNTITFKKHFWFSGFWEFHSKGINVCMRLQSKTLANSSGLAILTWARLLGLFWRVNFRPSFQ